MKEFKRIIYRKNFTIGEIDPPLVLQNALITDPTTSELSCSLTPSINIKIYSVANSSTNISSGDVTYQVDGVTLFNGNNQIYTVKMTAGSIKYGVQISSTGVISVINLCF